MACCLSCCILIRWSRTLDALWRDSLLSQTAPSISSARCCHRKLLSSIQSLGRSSLRRSRKASQSKAMASAVDRKDKICGSCQIGQHNACPRYTPLALLLWIEKILLTAAQPPFGLLWLSELHLCSASAVRPEPVSTSAHGRKRTYIGLRSKSGAQRRVQSTVQAAKGDVSTLSSHAVERREVGPPFFGTAFA